MITWARILEAFLELLNSLIEMFQKQEKRKDDNTGQINEDKINSDPARWFNNHFDSRVRDQETLSKSDTTSTKAADSDTAKK